jgi:hypothetical protein
MSGVQILGFNLSKETEIILVNQGCILASFLQLH